MAESGKRLKMGWRKRAFPSIAGFILLAVAGGLHFADPSIFARFGHQLFDRFQAASPRPYVDVGVRVVDIDEESLRRVGQWPWPRTLVADMTERLVGAGAGVVAFDIVFAEPDRTSPEVLGPVLARGGASAAALAALSDYEPHDVVMGRAFAQLPVVMGYFFERAGADTAPTRKVGFAVAGDNPTDALQSFGAVINSLDVIEAGAIDAGFVSIWPDTDGIVRRAPMLATLNGEIYPSLSLAVLRYVSGAGSYLIRTSTASGEFGAATSQVVDLKVGDFIVPTNGAGEMWMRFTAGRENRVVPAHMLLDENVSDETLRDLFEGTIVFVGTGAQGLYDLVTTPLDPRLPGVLVHAQALEQMLVNVVAPETQPFLRAPDWAPGVRLLSLLAGGLVLVLLVPIVGPLLGGVLGVGGAAGLFGLSWHLFETQGLLFDPVYPAAALLVVYGGVTSLVSFVVSEAEKGHIRDAFDRYLSPEMVAKIADDPSQLRLGGEEREMTILFSDIRGFSRLSEGMTPPQLTSYINRFLTPMTDILMDHRATVDKYIGDAIMSFWNAPLDDPDQHRNAANSAIAMIQKLRSLNDRVGRSDADPETDLPVKTEIGIGIFSGPTSVGNMGSDQRFAYSVLGDTVNSAARLEGMTKAYGIDILVGEALAQRIDGFAVLEVDRVRAVGKDTAMTIYALVGDEALGAGADFQRLATLQAEFLSAYRTKDFEGAQTIAEELWLLAAPFGLKPYYEVMKARIATFMTRPPSDDWQGIYDLTKK